MPSQAGRKVRFVGLPQPPKSAPLPAPLAVAPLPVASTSTRQARFTSPDLLQLLQTTRPTKFKAKSPKRKAASKKSKEKPKPKRQVPRTQALSISLESVESVRELLPKGKCSGKDVSVLLKFVEEVLDAQNQTPPALTPTIEHEGIKFEIQSQEGFISPLRPIHSTPLDVFNNILDYLDEASSTSLGLTCKAFWAIHKLRYPANNRLTLTSDPSPDTNSLPLYEILDDWMGVDRHLFAFPPFGDKSFEVKFLTKKQCLGKLLERSKGVNPAAKKGCCGMWEEGQARSYANYQAAVFRLCHEKVEVNGKELDEGFKWSRTGDIETPKIPSLPQCVNVEVPGDQQVGIEVRRGFY